MFLAEAEQLALQAWLQHAAFATDLALTRRQEALQGQQRAAASGAARLAPGAVAAIVVGCAAGALLLAAAGAVGWRFYRRRNERDTDAMSPARAPSDAKAVVKARHVRGDEKV